MSPNLNTFLAAVIVGLGFRLGWSLLGVIIIALTWLLSRLGVNVPIFL